MRLVTFVAAEAEPVDRWRVGALTANQVTEVAFASGDPPPETMLDLIQRGPGMVPDTAALSDASYAMSEVRLLAPLPNPVTVRDFMAFEEHVKNARASRGLDVPDAWYQVPVFYFSNPTAIRGPDEPVWAPPGSEALDYEFEVAVVIGKSGIDIPPESAFEYVAGFTVMNDWSARDLQMLEMQVMLGPAKGKDFATSIGPSLVTLDELADRIEGEHINLEMVGRLNGEVFTRGNLGDLYHTIPRLIAHASRGVRLHRGEILGTGTLGGGCLLEKPGSDWLKPGDVVELEVERLGVLSNPVAEAPTA